jgi:hypothetical protein
MTPNPKNSGAPWLALNRKFCENLQLATTQEEALCSRTEIYARAIPAAAELLRKSLPPTDWHTDVLCLFDEVFADVICSIYLGASGLAKPAQMSLRRTVEVGVASVYLWDLPHLFWAWKTHDNDLNMNEMLNHLASPGYLSFVRSQNSSYRGDSLLDISLARSVYRELSNIVHGKISTFECTLSDRFEHRPDDWRSHLNRVFEVEGLLIHLWQNRCLCVAEGLPNVFPQIQLQEQEHEHQD